MAHKHSVAPTEGPVYTAQKHIFDHGHIYIKATGSNATTGYHTSFAIDPGTKPVEVEFVNLAPTGIAADHITPFTASIVVKFEGEQTTVPIHDAAGVHHVPITAAVPLPPIPAPTTSPAA